MLLLGLIGAMVVGAIALIVAAVVQQRRAAAIKERLATFTERPRTLEELELELPFRERVAKPFVHHVLTTLGKLLPSKDAGKVKRNLELAGSPGGLTPVMFVGMRLTLALLGVVVGFYLTVLGDLPLFSRVLYSAIGLCLGYLLPGIWLGRKIKQRKNNILKSMPDALDLLSISVEAGLGFDLALQRVGDKWDNELSREFRRLVSDTRLGVPRRDAMRMMADRCGVEELSNFVQALIQAEQLGVSIGRILKVQSEQMRIRRRQRAEELAHQAPVKMLFPMVFLIFPSILVVILGPAIPKLMNSL
jgi:tight adherence protein C